MNAMRGSDIYEGISSLLEEVVELLKTTKKMRTIISTAPGLTTSTTINGAISQLGKFICKVIECERATIYALNKKSDFLWSKAATGSFQVIKVPNGQGIAGSCSSKNKVINIKNAYLDNRFNQAFDKASGFVTKAILCIPIRDKNGNVEGVVQAINKYNSTQNDYSFYFSKEDEGLLEMIGQMIGLFFSSTIHFSEQKQLLHSFREISKLGIQMSQAKQIVSIIDIFQEGIIAIFQGSIAKMYLRSAENPKLVIHYSRDNKIIESPIEGSLLQNAFEGKLQKVTNTYNHPNFNGNLDCPNISSC